MAGNYPRYRVGVTLRLAMALVVSASLGACKSDWLEDYDFKLQGELVTIYGYGHSESEVCGGSLAELEQHSAMIADELGIELEPFAYRWLSGEFRAALDEELCGGAAACANYVNGAISEVLPLMHEAVHMVTRNVGHGCPTLLDEGLAMHHNHAVRPAATDRIADPQDVRAYFEGQRFPPQRAEPDGMHVVSFIRETYGPRAIGGLCEVLPRQPSREEWDSAMISVLGVTLDEFLAEYESYPQCTYPQMRGKLWGCRKPANILLTKVGQRVVIESDCGDPQAVNVAGGPGDASLRRLLHVPLDMTVRAETRTVGKRKGTKPLLVITECSECSENPDVFTESKHPVIGSWSALERGDYELVVFFDRRDRVRLDLEVLYLNEDEDQ